MGIVPSDVCAASVMPTDESIRRKLLDRERVGERVGAAAAVLLAERDAHEPQLAHLRHQVVWEGLGSVELFGDRPDLVSGEVADRVADQALFVGK